jgi:transposase
LEVPTQRWTVHKHRNLLAHAPDSLHDEISADYNDMIYAKTAKEIVSVALAPPCDNGLKFAAVSWMVADIDSQEASEVGESSAHMSARMSAHTQRIEVITRGERRRRWSVEEKQAIVAESLEPNVSVAAIARKHGIGTGQLYGWRHQFLANRTGKTASFARVELLNEPHQRADLAQARSGRIEIVLPNGPTIRVDSQVDEHALRRVLGVLRG